MSSPELESESSLIETTPNIAMKILKTEDTSKTERSYYTYILSIVVVAIIVGLLYHSYSCYCTNQDLYEDSEGFIEKTIKSGTDSDSSFDVDDQVNQLIKKQDKYLAQIQQK
jgi:cell division protein FtsL